MGTVEDLRSRGAPQTEGGGGQPRVKMPGQALAKRRRSREARRLVGAWGRPVVRRAAEAQAPMALTSGEWDTLRPISGALQAACRRGQLEASRPTQTPQLRRHK